MRILFILTFLIVGCATEKPLRKPASEHTLFKVGIVDQKKSSVQVFPSVAADQSLWYYFFVQLKDQNGKFIDSEIDDIEISSKGKKYNFKSDRLLTGRYYLLVEKTDELSSSELAISVQGKPLKTQFKLYMRQPAKAHTSLKLMKNEANRLTFRLRLADKKNQPVEMPEKPEISIEGEGNVEDLVHLGEGVWEFNVLYPELNQVLYVSVRAMSVSFNRMYRHQHVEK